MLSVLDGLQHHPTATSAKWTKCYKKCKLGSKWDNLAVTKFSFGDTGHHLYRLLEALK